MATSTRNKATPRDWHATNETLWTQTRARQAQAQQTREAASAVAHATSRALSADKQHVDAQLEQRLGEIAAMTQRLHASKAACYAEIGRLLVAKDEVAAHIDHVAAVPTKTNEHNQALRDGRADADLVDDIVDKALDAEAAALAAVAKKLEQTLGKTEAQLRELKGTVDDLDEDLLAKESANAVDRATSTIDVASRHLPRSNSGSSGLLDTTRRLSTAATLKPEDWYAGSEETIAKAAADCKASQALGTHIAEVLAQAAQTVRSQNQLVEEALAKRIKEVDHAREQHQREIDETRHELRQQDAAIAALEQAIKSKEKPLAQTTARMETRAGRTGREAVVDNVHHGLLRQAEGIDRAVNDLADQLDAARITHDDLQDSLQQLAADIEFKRKSLEIDRACQKRRELYRSKTPRKTEYAEKRTPQQWESYGRTRAFSIQA